MDKKGSDNAQLQPLVSVIVPVYNVKEYLNRCLESLINQTYRNLEIILIDDGSTDGSDSLCDKWSSNDSRIKVIHSENHGVSHARNLGLNQASGDLISFIDSDDWVDRDWYKKLVKEMVRSQTDVCVGAFVRDDGISQWVDLNKGMPQILTHIDAIKELFKTDKTRLFGWHLCDKLYNRKILTGIRLNESIAMAEDMLFCFEAVYKSSKVSYYPTFGYHYRVRQGSATRGGASVKGFSSNFTARKLLMERARQLGDPLVLQIVNDFYYKFLIFLLRNALSLDNYASLKSEILEGQKEVRSNLFYIIRQNIGSIRKILGGVYFSLPYDVIIHLRHFVTRRKK